jgi:hydrogenase maturation protease
MTARALIAGIGNLFFGDDGFGPEVARRLVAEPPADAQVGDFGIAAIHLAYELLAPFELCIVADCTPRGGAPGTLYVIEAELAAPDAPIAAEAHGMSLPVVFQAVRGLGGRPPRTLVVGCEPEAIEPGIGLSASVARAVPAAVDLIRELIAQEVPS